MPRDERAANSRIFSAGEAARQCSNCRDSPQKSSSACSARQLGGARFGAVTGVAVAASNGKLR